MKSLNIGGDPNDPFYRYKMPMVETTFTKKNGGTVVITNAKEIAEAIKRSLKDIAKYMSSVTGSSVRVTRSTIVLQCTIDVKTLQCMIFDYIKEYVLCTACGNPETVIKENQQGCVSCGVVISLK